MNSILIRSKTDTDKDYVADFLARLSHDTHLSACVGAIDLTALPAWVAEIADEIVGLLAYQYQHQHCQIVSLLVSRKRLGVGESLLHRLEADAKANACKKISCVIGNDNLNALRFLQKRGFYLSELRVGAIAERRKHTPTIPQKGEHGIPLRDELILTKELSSD